MDTTKNESDLLLRAIAASLIAALLAPLGGIGAILFFSGYQYEPHSDKTRVLVIVLVTIYVTTFLLQASIAAILIFFAKLNARNVVAVDAVVCVLLSFLYLLVETKHSSVQFDMHATWVLLPLLSCVYALLLAGIFWLAGRSMRIFLRN